MNRSILKIYMQTVLCMLLFILMGAFPELKAQTSTAPSGEGTSGNPYQIATLDNLYWISQNGEAWGQHFIQTADIDASDTESWDDGNGALGFIPFGNDSDSFNGSYNGKGFTISNIFFDRTGVSGDDGNFNGMFGDLGASAEIDSLHLVNVDMTGNENTGGLVGNSTSGCTISNSSVSGTITGDLKVGGLVGQNHCDISESYTNVSVFGSRDVGGLTGEHNGATPPNNIEITDSYATGYVEGTQSANTRVGGLVGHNKGAVIESYASVIAEGPNLTGGLVGFNSGGFFSVSDSYWNAGTGSNDNSIGSDLTDTQMRAETNFSGFDFTSTWNIDEGTSHPYLQNNTQSPNPGTVISQLVPAEGDTTDNLRPDFIWSLVVADSFDVQVSTDMNFGSTVINEAGITGNSITNTPRLDKGTDYYWRVRAVESGTPGDWADTTAFVTTSTRNLIITHIQARNGSPGTSLAMYGVEFDASTADNTVTFLPEGGGSGTSATVTAASSTKLTVTIPDIDGGNYLIRVTRSSDSDADTLESLFSVTTLGGNFGDTGSSERVVSSSANAATSVYAEDVDGDGDIDLLSSSRVDDKIAWYENDGNESFTERVVSDTADGARSVYAIDIDADGDIDLMSASNNDNKIAWYESDGNSNPTFTEHIIATNASNARGVFAADMDGDGDTDLMSVSSSGSNDIVWYENNGAVDPSFENHLISNTLSGTWSVYAGDVDGDGDLDLMASSVGDDKIAWFENDGASDPSFSEHVISSSQDAANRVYAGDVDGDGDLDLMSASFNDNEIAWFENDGASDPSFTRQVVTTNANGATNISTGDVDGDGDLDLITAASDDDKIAWFKNDGATNPSFSEEIVSTNADNALYVYAADVDGDGDLDIMSASEADSKIAWYENKAENISAGQALSFDGTDDLVIVPDNDVYDDLTSMTIEAWIKPDAPTVRGGIIEKHDSPNTGWWIDLNTDISAIFLTGDGVGSASSTTDPIADTWYHLAVTYDGSNIKMYVNGIEENSTAHTGTITNNTRVVQIGELNWNSSSFNGIIDEVRVWNTARTQDQILQNMYQALNGSETGLITYYPFNEEGSTEVFDVASAANNATLSGGASRSSETHPYGTFITGSEGWRMMTAPVGGATYDELLDTLWTQGFTGADVTNGSSNVYTWSESSQSFTSIANATDIPAAGSGFIAFVYDDDDFDGTGDGFPKTIQTDSSQRSGSQSPALSYTDTGNSADDGWNLVGNPYGATIDWDASSGLTTSNLDASFYVWSDSANGGTGDYLSWNGATGTFGGGEIAPWQGFWVKANADDPSLSFTDDVRSAGGVFRKAAPVAELQFELTATNSASVHSPQVNGAASSSVRPQAQRPDGEPRLSSKAIMMFSEEATKAKDRLDAYKLQSLNMEYLSLFTQLPVSPGEDGSGLDINALPSELDEPLEVPVNLNGSELSGEFELSWNLQALPEDWSFTLTDNTTGEQVDLREASELLFEIDASATTASTQSVGARGEKHPGLPQAATLAGGPPAHAVLAPKVIKAKAGSGNAAGSPRFTLHIAPGEFVSNETPAELPTTVELSQNYPNPFNPSTNIQFGLPEAGEVHLEVYNLLGQSVATLVNERRAAGSYTIRFDARNLASGIYIYRLNVAGSIITKKLTLIK